MRHSSKKRLTLAELETMASRDKRRMFVMGIGALILGGAVIWTTLLKNQYESEEHDLNSPASEIEEPQAKLYLPPFQAEDRAILEEIADSTSQERLEVHQKARRTLVTYSAFLLPRHFVELGVRLLDAEATEELSKDPAGQRMMPFTTRGHVSSLGTFQSPDESFPEYRGQIESEYGGAVRFAVVKDPADDELTEGSFVLLDGLFLQWVRHETADGWQDMPMLCGRGLVPSSARLAHDQDHLDEVLAQVVDGTFDSGAEITGEAKWALLAKAQDENSGVNWDEALELDSDTLTSLFQNPKMYRGRAFRLPISVNMGLDDPVYGENPLRAEVLSTGWLGNQAWTGPAPVIKWVAAMDGAHLMDRKDKAHYLVGQGFFLKNLDYENADGRPLRAPVFAMRSLEIFTPPFDGRPERIMYMVAGLGGVMVLLFFGLLMRDKRDSRRLQENMVRRRRARRDANTDPAT
jgi:hypothetical protein